MKLLILFFALTILNACSHTIDFRSSHFLTPTVNDNQWGGHIAGTSSAATKITLFDDISDNPPVDNIKINEDYNINDFFLFNLIGFDASLSVLPSLELYLENSLAGVKWQFINHGKGENTVVAALAGGIGTRTVTTTSGDDTAKTKVNTTQTGLSIGYKLSKVVPYISYTQEKHNTSTDISNTHGDFGTFKNEGTHDHASIGISTHGSPFRAAIEYNTINLKWGNISESQNTTGIKLGYEW